MPTLDEVPRLSSRTRLRFDRVRQCDFLLYPERGLRLSATAAAILRLCDGMLSVAGIIDELCSLHAADRSVVERDVVSLLKQLEQRGLLAFDAVVTT